MLASSRDLELQRLAILQKLLSGEPCLVLASATTLQDWYPTKEYFEKSTLTLRYGKEYDFEKLIQSLQDAGYERISQIEGAGQFAVRGDLVDIGIPVPESVSESRGIRLSFFGDELEDIREFDFATQRSIETLEKIQIPPAKEWMIPQDKVNEFAENIRKAAFEQSKKVLQSGGDLELAESFERLGKRDASRLEQGLHFTALDRWFFLLEQEKTKLLQMAHQQNILLAFDDILQIQHRLDASTADFYQQMQSYLERGQVVADTEKIRLNQVEIWEGIQQIPTISFSQLDTLGNGISGSQKITFRVRDMDSYHGREQMFLQDWQTWSDTLSTIIVFSGSSSRYEKLAQLQKENHLSGTISEEALNRGFHWKDLGLIVVGSQDLFGVEKQKRRRKKQGLTIDFLSDLKPGDYVVHEDHGIGIYNGLKTLESGGKTGDYLHISYAGTDQLYISVDQLEQIQKYVSAGGRKPTLSKLDGKSWNNLKNRARESIKKLATNLIELYAQRMKQKGFAFSADTVWQEQFEETFPYTETEDQLIAIDEVKSDMESEKVMDRLLCGDVGFGKTEIAFRAMFKSAMDGKQSAMLVPTTVLAQQHYENLRERMKDFPVRVALLSRFVSPDERKRIVKKIKTGEIDIVIGTHRILSKDIEFKNLGLLIIDEEQRFGVDHKEGLKEKYPLVDVLSMTATPIPRTLHMSVSGIRDISVLEEAPSDRHPVQTYVMEYDEGIVEEAILKEIMRRGQVFYLFNNTHKIAEKAENLRKLMPGLRVEFAHGQMPERQLENVIEEFLREEFDVLVCTTIIESGVDMPNVNTIIVENADRLGLAQLYQIRGRVGRSAKQAYAYITYNPDKVLKEEATKRLAAIRDYTELGSGFKIALRDLEVRGAGNLLGAEQHGHMEAIGYELYCRMLEENVKDLQGQLTENTTIETQIELDVDARISESYIQAEGLRLDFYRRISQIKTIEEYRDVIDEMIDRFGEPPKTILNLCQISLIREMAGKLGIERIYKNKEEIILSFGHQMPNMELLSEILNKPESKNRLLFSAGVKPYILVRDNKFSKGNVIEKLFQILI